MPLYQLPTATVANDSITFAKIQNINADKLLGRDTAGSGDVEEISIDDTLELDGSNTLQRAALTGAVTAPAGSNGTALANAIVTPSNLATGAQSASVATSQATSSTSFVDLTTPGPAVTVDIGANGMALVIVSRFGDSGTVGARPTMGFDVSGNNTIAPSNAQSVWHSVATGASRGMISGVYLLTGLAAGSTTFTAKYKNDTAANSVTFQDRHIAVIPL